MKLTFQDIKESIYGIKAKRKQQYIVYEKEIGLWNLQKCGTN